MDVSVSSDNGIDLQFFQKTFGSKIGKKQEGE